MKCNGNEGVNNSCVNPHITTATVSVATTDFTATHPAAGSRSCLGSGEIDTLFREGGFQTLAPQPSSIVFLVNLG